MNSPADKPWLPLLFSIDSRLVHFNLAYHTHIMLPASVSPGYPTETLGHGLHNTFSMWLDEAAEQMRIDAQLLEGRLVRGETEDQTQEKMFVLRPFAFALHKVRFCRARPRPATSVSSSRWPRIPPLDVSDRS